MLIVTNAWTQQGWSPVGVSDDEITEMIGRAYAGLAALKRAAHKLADVEGYPTVEYRDQYGDAWRYDGSPDVPGRYRAVVRRV